MTTTFSPKDPTEAIYYGFDFAALLGAAETVSSATPAIRATAHADANASAMLSGAAVIDGTVVMQKITGGVAGRTYRLSITIVTSVGQTFVEAQDIEVATAT